MILMSRMNIKPTRMLGGKIGSAVRCPLRNPKKTKEESIHGTKSAMRVVNTIIALLLVLHSSLVSSLAMGPKTTSVEVIRAYGKNKEGSTALITGAGSGIGLNLAVELARSGMNVIAAVRDVERGREAIQASADSREIEGRIDVRKCDLGSLASVEQFATSMLSDYKNTPLDYAVYNAGIMATPTLEYTEDGFEKQIGVNHYGHAALNQFLYDKLCEQESKSRVVTLSSTAHGFGNIELDNLHFRGSKRIYTPWGAYGQSKLANLLFAKGLANKLKEDGYDDKVTSVSLHPGVIRTNLWRETPIKFGLFGALSDAVGFMDKSIAQGAATTAWAMLSPRIDAEAPSFQGAYLSDCGPAKPTNKQAFDDSLVEKFWKKTEDELKASRE